MLVDFYLVVHWYYRLSLAMLCSILDIYFLLGLNLCPLLFLLILVVLDWLLHCILVIHLMVRDFFALLILLFFHCFLPFDLVLFFLFSHFFLLEKMKRI